MTHVFIAPHPDDVALSCGGLIASLRELGQAVTIVTVFSGGAEAHPDVTDHQRTALGFGNKTMWPLTEAFDRGNLLPEHPEEVVPAWQADPARLAATQERANTQARQFWQRAAWTRSANVTNLATAERPIADDVPVQGTLVRTDVSGANVATMRRLEDERYAWFMEVSLVDLGLPDAIHRGYEGDDQLLGGPRDDDLAPIDLLRREILRLEPQRVYAPLGIGGHVDHVLCREAALAIAEDPRSWVMPAQSLAGRLSFYEDFPYAWWDDFHGQSDLPAALQDLPDGLTLAARYADISDVLDRKAAGVAVYASQVPSLFHSEQGMHDDIAGHARRVALAGGVGTGSAERYWSLERS
ncbi:MAG: PIG-L family deacetylase [Chloroflexi bacterium]|nr:PIG-L family deacetylase [Chloroflexota bacterium]